ncbi:MAG: hypothetical protein ACRCXT_07245 [Paraclostridium sp.]
MKKNNKIKDINEYKKKKKNNYKKRKLKKAFKFLIKPVCVTIVFGIIVSCMYGYSEMSRIKYKIGELEDSLHNKEIERDNLMVDLDILTRSKDIESKAKEEYGMDYPSKSQIEYIEVLK